MTTVVPPMIDSRVLLNFLGNSLYFQSMQLVNQSDSVGAVEFDEQAQQINGSISADGHDHAPQVQLRRAATGWDIEAALCTCNADGLCPHVGALVLASNQKSKLAQKEQPLVVPEPTSWSKQIASWFAEPESGPHDYVTGSPNEPITPMALEFQIFDLKDASDRQQLFNGVRTQHQGNRRFRLGIRPMVRNAEGRWVRGQLRWTTIAFKLFGWNLLASHHHWFARLAALYRSNTQPQFKVDEDWLFLDEYSTDLLWPLLAEAEPLGIEFITRRGGTKVQILSEPAAFALAARLSDEEDLQVNGELVLDGLKVDLEANTPAGTIGDFGYYLQSAPSADILLAPSAGRLADEYRTWFEQHAVLEVPRGQIQDFYATSYPMVARTFPIHSVDEKVHLPELRPPYVLATVEHKIENGEQGEREVATLDFQINYPGIKKAAKSFDPAAEDELKSLVNQVFERTTDQGNPDLSPKFYSGLQMIDFVDGLLPALEAMKEVRLVEYGKRPVYRRLRELPKLSINAVESEQNDWLDLAILVKVEGHDVPLADIIQALSRGHKKLKLPDNTWFSLDHPDFATLSALIDEAHTLNDKPKDADLKLSVFQLSLFDELDQLAEGISGADLFVGRMRSLLRVAEASEAQVPSQLNATLRPYQLEGYRWLARLYRGGFGGILADDMGLGKTLQTIALMLYAQELWQDPQACAELPAAQRNRAPFLVVAPSSVVSNWEMEIHRFAPSLKVVSIDSTLGDMRTLRELADQYDVILTTYTLLRLNSEIYESQQFGGLILDEAQFVKNRTTKAHKAAVNLRTNFKLAVTGTPMENNLGELGSLLSLTAPALFVSITRFNRQFARPIEVLGDRDALALLQRRVKPFMLRRTKESVVLDLPEKQEQQLLVRLTEEHQHVYETHLTRERQKILRLVEDLDRNRFTIFQSLTHLRLLALEPRLVDPELAHVPGSKLEALFDQLDEVLNEGHRALVFSQFTSYLKILAEQLTARGVKFVYLDGSTRDRASVIEQFKDGEAPLFLISLKAGGFGLNLTEADYCFLLDPWWNPAVEAQAIDRTHRIGQTRQVMVYRMIAQGTIEEKVVALQESKRKLISTVMDEADGFSKALTAQDIRGLLE